MATAFDGRKFSDFGYQYDNKAFEDLAQGHIAANTAKKRISSRKKRFIAAAIVFVALAGLILGLAFGLYKPGSDDDETKPDGHSGTHNDTLTSAPTTHTRPITDLKTPVPPTTSSITHASSTLALSSPTPIPTTQSQTIPTTTHVESTIAPTTTTAKTPSSLSQTNLMTVITQLTTTTR